ncbi:MAG: lysostaphin resistance A-like protein [Sarcina sp.]
MNFKDIRKPIFKSSLFFLFLMIWPMFAGRLISPFLPKDISYPILLIITHIILFILPAIVYILITRQSFKKVLRLNKIGLVDICIAIGIGFIAQPVMSFFAYISSFFFTNDVAGMLNELNSAPLWLMILMIGVTPSISEEITMRGIILSGYDFKSKHVAAIMSGLVFGIIHNNPHQFLYAFVMGVIFGYMVRAANSIFVAMIAHFTINTSQLLLQRAISSTQDMLGQTTAINPEDAMNMLNSLPLVSKIAAGVFYGAIALVGFFIIRALIRTLEKRRVRRVKQCLESRTNKEYVTIEEIQAEVNGIDEAYTRKQFKCSVADARSEGILNIPFIIACIIFIVSMIGMIWG